MSKWGFALAFLIVAIPCFSALAAEGLLRPVNLRCEYRQNPLGIDTLQPRVSWTLEPTDPKVRGQRQTAYQILAASSEERLRSDQGDLWDTGTVKSDKSIHVPCEGKPLGSGMQVWWKVRVWDDHGNPSAWSEPAFWSMGLLKAEDWKGKWIGLDGGEGKPEQVKEAHWIWSSQPGPGTRYFRRTIEIPRETTVSDALLYLVGSGASTLYINGKEVKSAKGLKDPISQDITQALHSGANILAVAVSVSGDAPSGLIGALEMELARGDTVVIHTDGQWRVSPA
jgi:alpha-L-rhamnosidase